LRSSRRSAKYAIPQEDVVAIRRTKNASSKAKSGAAGRARVAILMGSASDWDTMKPAADVLSELGVVSDVRVISAHRTPARHHDYVTKAEGNGIEVFIAGAGSAAHLAGVTAALTLLPVLGVPIDSSPLQGLDALLATVQMPGGIPVGTLAIGKPGAKNAGLLAAAILARKDPSVRSALARFRERQTAAVPQRPF
jgi:5-(carboxyamino)imidazole ribonucleotide mutase